MFGSKSYCESQSFGSQCSEVNVKEAVWESVCDRQCLDLVDRVKESLWESVFESQCQGGRVGVSV